MSDEAPAGDIQPEVTCASPAKRRHVWWFLPLAAALVGVLGWAGGLLWFIVTASRPVPPPPNADGIVALTGGAARIETALQLLSEDHAGKLLITGVGGNLDLPALARRAGLDPAPLASRVTLGRNATSTHGNAIEAETWVRENRIRTLIVVTAYYHMPRAMTEFSRAMPDVHLYPYPVLISEAVSPGHPVPLRLLIEEFTKYLAAKAGFSGWPTLHEAPHGAQGG